MKRVSLALAVMILTFTGCQDRRFVNAGRAPGGNETDIESVAREDFGKEYGMSKAETLEYFRSGATLSGDSRRDVASDPPFGSSILDTGEELSGEATATDFTSKRSMSPSSSIRTRPISTAGGSSTSRF